MESKHLEEEEEGEATEEESGDEVSDDDDYLDGWITAMRFMRMTQALIYLFDDFQIAVDVLITFLCSELEEAQAKNINLMKEKEEEVQAVLEELATILNCFINSERDASESKSKNDDLVKQLEKAKQSERKMHELLVSQTKLLAETKESLEEAKVEIMSLKESSKSLQTSKSLGSQSGKTTIKQSWKSTHSALVLNEDDESIMLKNNLELAMEGGEKSKAMDDLASALKEVTIEANEVKGRLFTTQSELEKVRPESNIPKSLLHIMEEKSQAKNNLQDDKQTLVGRLSVDEAAVANNVGEQNLVAATSADNSSRTGSLLETASSSRTDTKNE